MKFRIHLVKIAENAEMYSVFRIHLPVTGIKPQNVFGFSYTIELIAHQTRKYV
jgi:hypothetical protein